MGAIGQAYGLVWTPYTSSLVQFKTKIRKGTGKLIVDGDIGQEFFDSVKLAFQVFDNLYQKFNINNCNILVDVPTPLDGSSAGLPILLSMCSAYLKIPLNQSMAFTGGLTADGGVLAVEDIISKLEAVKRGGLDSLLLPLENMSHFKWIDYQESIRICGISNIKEALDVALMETPKATKLNG